MFSDSISSVMNHNSNQSIANQEYLDSQKLANRRQMMQNSRCSTTLIPAVFFFLLKALQRYLFTDTSKILLADLISIAAIPFRGHVWFQQMTTSREFIDLRLVFHRRLEMRSESITQ